MTQTETVTTEALRQAVLTVLDYLWQQEREHFLASPPPDRADHVLHALTVLARWLGRDDETPAS